MTVDESIKSVLASVEGKLIDAGYPDAARDAQLRAAIEQTLRASLAPVVPPAAPQAAPNLAGVNIPLQNIAELLKLDRDAAPDAVESHCSVFLGAGAHFPEPAYPPPAGQPPRQPFPVAVRPPVGSTLAKELAGQCAFANTFPNEYDGDWMRVSTWHEWTNGRNGPIGLEGRIRSSVETGKRGSEMLDQIASWPCRTFYTTNFDTHLENALLKHHDEIFVWAYHPKAFKDNPFDLRMNWWRMTPGKDAAKPGFERWAPAMEPILNGQLPPEPPADKIAVFKLHGDVRVPGSVVITDDDYIKFLRRIAKFELPRRLLLPLSSTILFIGYSLRDFNMRYVLSMLREERDRGWDGAAMSYAVDLRPDPLFKVTWQQRNGLIQFVEHNLWDIVPEISNRLK